MATSPTSTFKVSARLRTSWHRFHLDMTPMVGLAFLLLTFFLLHAGVAKPRILPLTMPVADKSDTYGIGICLLSETMTIILGDNHQLHYYHGMNNPLDPSVPTPELRTTDFSALGIRQMLLVRRSQQPEPVILIKPAPGATYKDMVDILDEMNITSQKKYALVPLGAADRQLLLANGQR
ncbi:biopolymer transporter ExbD [Hymenobacter bucti]|uniref:Biopolymer transporter ExbD n=1 Tax=Hymenobacter bucti TaxID=1844114 RepID=A0ABW4QWH3_9BACT